MIRFKVFTEGVTMKVETAATVTQAAVVKPLEITENGTYTAPSGTDGFAPVTVNVPVPDEYIKPSGELSIEDNGAYDVREYASVNVSVPVRQGNADLPEGYSRCDYIQFAGEQIVDTRIVCNQNTKIQTHFTREVSTQEYLYGVASSDNTASVTAYLGGSWRFGNKSATKTITTINQRIGYDACVGKTEISVTNNVGTISGVNNFETVGSLLIGSCRNSSGEVGTAQYDGKISFFDVWSGIELVLKLVPVTDGATYRFFDMVSKSFFDSIPETPLNGGYW